MRFPVVGGHEGAGVVDAVGDGVTRVKVGDHVVCSFIPACGSCRYCSTGRQNLCDAGQERRRPAQFPDGTFRFHQNGEDFGGLCVLGTFSEFAVVSPSSPSSRSPTTSPSRSPRWSAAACRPAGGGGARRRRPGRRDRGRSTAPAASAATRCRAPGWPAPRTSSWSTPSPFKREMAQVFGATHTFATAQEAADFVVEATWGELADHAIITVGVLHDEVIARRPRRRRQDAAR